MAGKLLIHRITLLLSLLGCLPGHQALAQREYFNWHFGDSTGVSFLEEEPLPKVLVSGKVKFSQGAASLSDATGRFAFASDGYTVWDRNWKPLAGRNVSQTLRNFSTNARQVLAVPQPGNPARYYVFVSHREFYANEFPVNTATRLFLPFVVVDMREQRGLGGIVAHDSLRLPNFALHTQVPNYGLTGNWVGIRHANGRDVWLVGITTEGQYLSWLLEPTGLTVAPVVSLAPRWLGINGILKASPDGRTLALLANTRDPAAVRVHGQIELSDFNTSTGQLTNSRGLPTRFKGSGWFVSENGGGGTLSPLTGLEFSPDGSRLYVDSAGTRPLQYNLLAGSPQAIDRSRVPIDPVGGGAGAALTDMKLGPDGRIYLSYRQGSMGYIDLPNALGNACRLHTSQPNLRPRSVGTGTLPLTTNDLNLPPVIVASAGSIAAGRVCAGVPLQFVSSLSPFITAAAYAWDFGDPASGSLNTAAGQAPAHSYQQGGQYTVTLRVTAIDGRQFTTSQSVQVYASPVVDLGPDLVLCADERRVLRVEPQPAGSTYQWQDGSTASTNNVTAAGVYQVKVTTPDGCTAADELVVAVTDCADLPNIITPNGDGINETFVLRGLNASEWHCQLFNRWSQCIYDAASYGNDWNAANQPAGIYYYLLTNPITRQQHKGWVQVAR